jgi:hypothetical protein
MTGDPSRYDNGQNTRRAQLEQVALRGVRSLHRHDRVVRKLGQQAGR